MVRRARLDVLFRPYALRPPVLDELLVAVRGETDQVVGTSTGGSSCRSGRVDLRR
jgi:hypothetical protein